jgi:putrescine transport system substrate-binding protein
MMIQKLFLIWMMVASPFAWGKGAEPPHLNIYHWHNMIDPEVLEDFTKETGIEVHLDVYDSNEILETKLLVGHSGYDIVGPSALPYLGRQIPAEIYMPLDYTLLPNIKKLDPEIMTSVSKADPGNVYALPFLWGLVGFAYDARKVGTLYPNAPVDSWAMMFDPEVVRRLAPCGITFLTESTDIFLPVYLYLGIKPDSHDIKDLDRIVAHLQKVRPYIARFDAIRPPAELLAGEVCMSMLWVGDMERVKEAFKNQDRAADIKIVIPKEGTALWIDCLAIPVDAPHPNNAHRFLNFILRPDIIARITNKTYFPNAVPESLPYVKEILRANPAFFPDPQTRKRLFINENVPPSMQRKLNRAMTKVRTGR